MTTKEKARKPNGNAPTGIMSAIAAAQAQHEAEARDEKLTLAEQATKYLRECRESLSETTLTRISPLVRTLAGSFVAVSRGRMAPGRAFCRATAKWSNGVLTDATIFLSRLDKTAADTITAVTRKVKGEETISHYRMTYDIAPNADIGGMFHHLSETGAKLTDIKVVSTTFEVRAHVDENGRPVIPVEEIAVIMAAGKSNREYARLRGF